MRKIIKILFILLAIVVFNKPVYATGETIAIFPVDKTISATSLTPYPNIINLVASDLANILSDKSYFRVIDLNSSENLIKSKGLYNKYKKLLEDYKASYVMDYDTLGMISGKIGANKILVVSGGYDVQTMFLKRGWLNRLEIPETDFVTPSYRLNILLSLVDAQTGVVIWEKIYRKDFEADKYTQPSPFLMESVIATQELKSFSKSIAYDAKMAIEFRLAKSQYTQVHSEIITTQPSQASTNTSTGETKDGLTTRDGHSYSTDSNYLIDKRKNNYKNWIKNSL